MTRLSPEAASNVLLRDHIREATPARVERHWLDKPLQFAAAFIVVCVALYAVVA